MKKLSGGKPGSGAKPERIAPGHKKTILVVLVSLAGLIFFTAVYARMYPEKFFSTGIGRAIGSRLIRRDFVRSYIGNRPGILINPRTVRFGLRQAGMEDIESFREQMRAGRERMDWDSLSPSRKRRYFQGVFDTGHLRYTLPFLMSLPEEHREEVVGFVAETIRTYRTEMTREEAVELHRHMNSPEGRRALSGAQRYFLTELTPEQFKAISPIVDEIVITAAGMLD